MSAFERLCLARWPNGPICPFCGSDDLYSITTRGRLACAKRECRRQFSPTTRTVFSGRKLTTEQCLKALAIFPETSSPRDMERRLGVTYKTAHRVWHALNATGGAFA